MKILFIIDKLTSGGRERRMLELIRKLSQNSAFEILLVVMDREIAYPYVLNYNIKINYLIRKTTKDLSVFFKFFKICKKFKPNIIHSWSSMSSIYVLPTKLLLRINLVNSMINHAPDKLSIFSKERLRALLTFPFSNIILSNSLAGLKAYKPSQKKSRCIYNGFDFNRTKTMKPKSLIVENFKITTKYIIIMCARVDKSKDYDTLIEAARTIRKKGKDVSFLCVGDGNLLEYYKSMLSKDEKEYIIFTGVRNDVEDLINASDIGVLCSYSEGFSNSILEYMALAKPVIATQGGGTNEIVIDNETGFLIKSKEVNGLINKIEILLENRELRNKMGMAGERRISENFTIDKMTGKFIDIYENLNARI